MSTKYLHYSVIAFALACALGACSSPDKSASPVPAATSRTSEYSTKPFTANEVKVQITQNGDMSLDTTGKILHVPVMIDNQGSVDFDSTAKPPVNIGARLLNGAGAVSNANLVHASLGNIHAGSKGAVTVDIPSDQLVDHSIEILPLQEGVAWFDAFGVKPLKIGPFKTCAAADGSEDLCVGDGAAIVKK